ncbi:MAG: hypothetical protein COA54_09960 [Thiotrichaceae bacterium]|nr:MAG: hypothetical protein COA54_09960 [Thiotrichaceae bacterium]
MKFISKMTPVAAALAIAFAAPVQAIDYEVWASDQSNSVAGASGIGKDGSFLQIFEGADVEKYAAGTGPAPSPIPCAGTVAPCDAHAVFPGTLIESDASGLTGETLATSNSAALGTAVGTGDDLSIGRLHGALPDPQHKYVNVNLFSGGRGYVGIVTADTKEAVALWRVTRTNTGESLHMSFWSPDGTALYLANLHGRILERIDMTRDENGNILTANFNQAASMSVGASSIVRSARAYSGLNAAGNAMISTVSGAYDAEATALDTPNGKCRQNGCSSGAANGSLGGRPGNVIVCPIVSSNDKVYVTFGGGGLLVADGASTPMQIVGEYGNQIFNGAGCGGVEAGGNVYLNAGASAAGGGATQSVFSMYRVSTNFPDAGSFYPENFPRPRTIFKDVDNTSTGGATSGPASNATGQLPGISTRRDAHGAVGTTSGHYVHNADRVRNNVVSFNVATGESHTYSLAGTTACSDVAADAVPLIHADDVTPDLMDRSPNGDFLFFAARGPVPHSVPHSAQGACPGVGVIKLSNGGKSGSLAAVVRTTNTIDDVGPSASGGYAYTGVERSDPHGVAVVIK